MIISYLVSDSIRLPSRQIRLGRVVSDSAEFSNPSQGSGAGRWFLAGLLGLVGADVND